MSSLTKILVVFLMAIGSTSLAQNALFEKGNALYNDGKFQEAINAYKEILSADKHSAEVYFNLANAYYKTNQVAPSIYYYEKALQLSPNDKDIQNNLAFAQNMTIDAIDIIPEVGFTKLINNTTNTFSFDAWSLIAISGVILFVMLFLIYYFSYSTARKRLLFVSSFACLILGLIALTFAFKKYDMVQNDRPAIVFAEESEIKTEPNLRSDNAFSLHEGTKVQVLEDFDDNWSKIQLSDGKTGWILKNNIKLLNDF